MYDVSFLHTTNSTQVASIIFWIQSACTYSNIITYCYAVKLSYTLFCILHCIYTLNEYNKSQTPCHTIAYSRSSASEPLFSVGVYFGFMGLLMLSCGIAFYVLNNHHRCIAAQHTHSPVPSRSHSPTMDEDLLTDHTLLTGPGVLNSSSYETEPATSERSVLIDVKLNIKSDVTEFLILGWNSLLLNGMSNGIMSYACMPYGERTYEAANTLNLCIAPIGGLLTVYYTIKSRQTQVRIDVCCFVLDLLQFYHAMSQAFGHLLMHNHTDLSCYILDHCIVVHTCGCLIIA